MLDILRFFVGAILSIMFMYGCMFGLGAKSFSEATGMLFLCIFAGLTISVIVLAMAFAVCGTSLCS